MIQPKIKRTKLLNAMLNALKRSLACDNHAAIAQLARHICHEQTSQTLEQTIITLLKDGFSVAELISALLHCESERMKLLFSGHSALPLDVQFADLKRTIHGFNDIQDMVMEVGERFLTESQVRNLRGAARLPGNSEDRGHDNEVIEQSAQSSELIEAAISAWSSERSVRLFNQFRGIPINATAQLLGKGRDKLRITLDREIAKVFASHPRHDTAYLVSTDGEYQIEASIIQAEKGSITLQLGTIAPAYVEKRRDLGVQVAEKIDVQITGRGRVRSKLQLFDLSISGLGLIATDTDSNAYQSGDEIECDFMLGGKRIRTTGWIRWQQQAEQTLRIGIELKSDRALQQTLQQEIFRIQRSIIVAMNEIELPKALRDALNG